MKEFKTVEKTVKELAALTCNKCGCKKPIYDDSLESLSDLHEFQSFMFSFGYGSKFDEQVWEFDLCENCLEDFVATFAIKPEIKNF